MSWRLNCSLTTRTLPSVSQQISKEDLKAGDIILKPGDHVLIFHKWSTTKKDKYWTYEFTKPKAIYREIKYPYYNPSGYLPYRFVEIIDNTENDTSKPMKPF